MRRNSTRSTSLRWVVGTAGVVAALLVLGRIAGAHHQAGPEEFGAHVLTAIVAALVAGTAGALAFADRTRKRLESLVEKLHLVAAGDYTARADIKAVDELGEIGRAFNSMVASLASSRDLLIEKANTDSVTGLNNHRYFQERLAVEASRAARYGSALSLLMIDIDHFKLFNDINGHPAGDHALRQIADIIAQQVRDVDIAARYGGEEFAVILPETSADQAHILAERIRQAAESCVFEQPSPQACKLTISIGLAEYPAHCSDRASLLRAADGALCQAKMMGRNAVATCDCETDSEPKPDLHRLCMLLHGTDLAAIEALAAAIDAGQIAGTQFDPEAVKALLAVAKARIARAA